jgi:Glycosyltransferase family 87
MPDPCPPTGQQAEPARPAIFILHTTERLLKWLMVLVAAAFTCFYYWAAYHRFRYPMQLEWLEGGVLDMVRRVVAHQPVYAAPGKNFVPFIYTPFYCYVSAWASRLFGLNLSTLRLVSIASTTGCLVLIFQFVRRLTARLLPAAFAAGLFAALYVHSTLWFDVGRVDMLYLFFLLLAIDLAERGLPIWAGLAFACAFETKQTAIVIALIVLAHEWERPRRFVAGLLSFLALAGGSALLLNHQTHGWYFYYTFFLPSHQQIRAQKVISFFLHDLGAPLGISLLLILAALLFSSKTLQNKRRWMLVSFTTIGVGISCFSSRLHLGGTNNVTLPLWAWICMMAGLALYGLIAETQRLPDLLGTRIRIAVLAACSVQFLQLIERSSDYIPTHSQIEEAARVNRQIAQLPGPLFVIHNVIDPGSAGQQSFANTMAVWDVLRADHGPAAQHLRDELVQSLKDKEYAGIISDVPANNMLPVEEPFLREINQAATASYPVERPILSPLQSMLFFGNPQTPGVKPNVLYLPGPLDQNHKAEPSSPSNPN